MTTNRPYQKAMSMEEGIRRMEVLSGRVFDPVAVKEFVAGMRRGDYAEVYDEACRQVEDTKAGLDRIELDDHLVQSARANLDPDCLPPEVEGDPPLERT